MNNINKSSDVKINLKRNMKIIGIKNDILNKDFNQSTSKDLIECLFSKDSNDDYIINHELNNLFQLSENEILDILTESIAKIDNLSDFDYIINFILEDIERVNLLKS